jgi:hypothetical protein
MSVRSMRRLVARRGTSICLSLLLVSTDYSRAVPRGWNVVAVNARWSDHEPDSYRGTTAD